MGFFGDLMRLIQQQGPVSWDAARQLALSIALDGESEPNIDPLERMRFEQLGRVADLHVAQTTGLTTSPSGRGVTILPVTRTLWVQRTLDAYRPLVEQLADRLGSVPPTVAADDDEDEAGMAWLGGLMQMLGPMLLGMTAGSMLGHLGRRAFGQYDLPLPRPAGDELMVAVPNLDEFGDAWSLPAEDFRLWVCVHEVTHHAVLSLPHVRDRMNQLVHDYVGGFEPTTTAFDSKLGELDLGNPDSLERLPELFGDPEAVLGAIQSDAQRQLLPHLDALVAVVVGYVDHVMDTVGNGLIGSYSMLTEALRRRRVTADPSDRFVERLFGLGLTQEQYERGAAFVAGVVERAGTAGLERLWRTAGELPTPAEVDAPGLWLARIDLPED
jgi:putative hydrolase